MIKAIALDDEPLALQIIEKYCQIVTASGVLSLRGTKQTEGVVLEKTFTRTKEAIQYLAENSVDLLFLDINMPTISGIDFYKNLPSKAMVIFTTAYSEYAIDGFDLNAVDYLLKPFTLERFQQAIEKATLVHRAKQPEEAVEYIQVRINYALTPIKIADILFIEALDNYIKIYLVNQKPLMLRMAMKKILEQLPNRHFMRVHKSYIVALDSIDNVRNKIIGISHQKIPIGKSFEEDFFKIWGNR